MYPAERKEGVSLKYLVIKAQQGDAQAFVRLMEMNKQSMYKIARSYFTSDEDIADAIQDTIETCYRSISHLAESEYFRTWLTRILINKCIDIIRKNKREHPVSDFPEYGEVSRELDNSEFNELMNSLDEKYRTILLLYYGEGHGGKHSKDTAFQRTQQIQGNLDLTGSLSLEAERRTDHETDLFTGRNGTDLKEQCGNSRSCRAEDQ